jgi:acetyl-CoA synthetase
MLPLNPESYDDLVRTFTWPVPKRYNIGTDVTAKWAEKDPGRLALLFLDAYGKTREFTFGQMHELSNQLAGVLVANGVEPGDRVAVLLPQAPETAMAHVAAYKAGCISIPLFTLFGEEALAFRLGDSGAKVVVTNAEGAARIAALRSRLPQLQCVLCTEPGVDGTLDLHAQMRQQSTYFTAVDTAADDPAVIIYTSGTTGNPKGALHGHRVLLGHLPGVEMSHNLLPHEGDRFWTPADWAWIGGLFDVLMPAWHHGICVVAHRFQKFTPEAAFQLMQDFKVRNTFLPPTALKMMRTVQSPETRWSYRLRSVASGGESLGTELLDWGRRTFGLTINEFYGQTECNMTVSSCGPIVPGRAGVIGRPAIGHTVAVIDDNGAELPAGHTGHIAVRRPDPVMFLGYWNNTRATAEKFIGDWLVTGDTGSFDPDGYVRFMGRNDDVITSAGYRIGPGEIEDSLLQHSSVKMAAVIGAPDPQRTEVVVAIVVLQPGVDGTEMLKKELQDHVKTRLAAHEYPREVYFVDELPMTTTGKIIRRELRARVQQWRAAKSS